jgi:hypothetical protein
VIVMAQLRLVGEPGEVQAVLDALDAAVRVTDVTGPGASRKTPGHVLVYAHVEPPLAAQQPRRRPASISPRSAR